MKDYPTFHHSRSTALLTLPPRLGRETIIQQCHEWSRRNGLAINRYYDHSFKFLPPVYMVKVRILGFPLSYWDTPFFQLAISGFGKLVQVHADNLTGDDRSILKLWMECRDTYAIPEYLIPNFADRWCTCRVQVEFWYPIGWIPPPPAVQGPNHPHTQPTMFDLLLQCHRRVLDLWRTGVTVEATDHPLLPENYPVSHFSMNSVHRELHVTSTNQFMNYSGSPDYLDRATTFHTPSMLHKNETTNTTCPQTVICQLTSQKNDDKFQKTNSIMLHSSRSSPYLTPLSSNSQSREHTSCLLHGTPTNPLHPPSASHVSLSPLPTTILTTKDPTYPQPYTSFLDTSTCPPHVLPTDISTENPPKFLTDLKRASPLNLSSKQVAPTPSSILGPYSPNPQHNLALLKYNTGTTASFIPSQNHHQSRLLHLFLPETITHHYKDTMDAASEELIRKFAGLSHSSNPSVSLTLTNEAVHLQNPQLCLLVRAITDRSVIDSALIDSLLRAWNVDPQTIFEPQSKNQLLVEFKSFSDLMFVRNNGPWFHRQEFVAVDPVPSSLELSSFQASTVHMWIQLHNIPRVL